MSRADSGKPKADEMANSFRSFGSFEQLIAETDRGLTISDMLKFLYRYGYFNGILDLSFADVAKKVTGAIPEFREALKRFQDFYGLKPDEDPGPLTQRAMQRPRCGCPDIMPEAKQDEPAAIENYQGQGYWPISKMPEGVAFGIADNVPNKDAIREAAMRWNRVCGINLVEAKAGERANIVVTFKRIDGGGSTLALGWFPMQNSPSQTVEQRLDSGERWNFAFQAEVSCHEFGHNMGWNHKTGSSVMHPYASGQWPEPTAYDIGVAQDYYGMPADKPTPDEPDEPDVPTGESNPFSSAKLFLPDPETGELGEYFIAPVTEYGGV